MQFLSYLLFQLDEAARYIEDGRLEHLRLALLLLDNAAEIQMDRRIRDDLERESFREKIRNTVLAIDSEHKLPPMLQELVDWTPLSPTEKHKVDRFFDEKVEYLVGRGQHLDIRLSGPLKHVHKYRNEAYHRAEVRTDTIRTAALLLLEINCQMLLAIPPGTRSFSSTEDYSWLEKRFHIKAARLNVDLSSIAAEIRSKLLPNDEHVVLALVAHLKDRFEQLQDSLKSIVEDGGLSDKENALRESQRYAEIQRALRLGQKPTMGAFVAKYSLSNILELEARVPEVSGAPTRIDAFDRFGSIEKELEPIEDCVSELGLAIDKAIQMEIDIARGK
jgi:hypothetical protein